jgi:hypothetical protein
MYHLRDFVHTVLQYKNHRILNTLLSLELLFLYDKKEGLIVGEYFV